MDLEIMIGDFEEVFFEMLQHAPSYWCEGGTGELMEQQQAALSFKIVCYKKSLFEYKHYLEMKGACYIERYPNAIAGFWDPHFGLERLRMAWHLVGLCVRDPDGE